MGLRLNALKKFFMTDRRLIRSVVRKVMNNQKEEQKLHKDFKEILKAKNKGLTDDVSKSYTRYINHCKKELDLLDAAISNLFVEKKRNVERIYDALSKAKTDDAKLSLQQDLNIIRVQIDKWFKILQAYSEGGRIQFVNMDDIVLSHESESVARVASRKVSKLKRDEKKALKSPSKDSLEKLRKDLDIAIELESKLFQDLEQLTSQEEGSQLLELQKLLNALKDEQYPSTDLTNLIKQKSELESKLKTVFANQIKNLNTLIKIS